MAATIRPDTAPAKPGQPEEKGSAAIADPGPLGLAAFAMTTFVLSVFNANIIGTLALVGVLLPLALFYGGMVQILAGMWEFRKNNTLSPRGCRPPGSTRRPGCSCSPGRSSPPTCWSPAWAPPGC